MSKVGGEALVVVLLETIGKFIRKEEDFKGSRDNGKKKVSRTVVEGALPGLTTTFHQWGGRSRPNTFFLI